MNQDKVTTYLENDIFRMERSILNKKNIDTLNRISENDIPEHLLYYISYEHQYNIFGYGIIDPESFAMLFGYSSLELKRKHPNPFQRQLKIIAEGEKRKSLRTRKGNEIKNDEIVCDTKLENALFILSNFPLRLTSTTIVDNAYLVRSQETFLVLDNFTIIQDIKTGKVHYLYHVNDKFRRNLSTFYQNMSLNSLINLRGTKATKLYRHILAFRDALFAQGMSSNTPETAPDFDYLCELAEISKNLLPKYRKDKLKTALNKIATLTELKFKYEWVKGSKEKEKYTLILHFDTTFGDIPLLNSLTHTQESKKRSDKINIVVNEFKHNLYNLCPLRENRYSDTAKQDFHRWLMSLDNEDEKTVQDLCLELKLAFVNAGCKSPNLLESRINNFINIVKNENDLDKLDECISRIVFDPSKDFKLYAQDIREKTTE